MNKFFTTALGSYTKVFLSGIISAYFILLQSGIDLFSMDKKMISGLLTAGLISLLPVLQSALNPKDTRFGKQLKPKNFPAEPKNIK